MTRKILIITAVAALMIAGVTQIAFAGQGVMNRETCGECLEGLTPEQQELVTQARENHRAATEELVDRQRGERTQLREAFLAELPEDLREHMEARMGEKEERREQRMEKRGDGSGNVNGRGMGKCSAR